MTDLTALIHKLEQAKEGSRELDYAIQSVFVGAENVVSETGSEACGCWWDTKRKIFHAVPYFTSSLDAAMTLVPEGLAWTVSNRPLAKDHWASVANPLHDDDGNPATAKTAPLALCLASLRARQQQQQGER